MMVHLEMPHFENAPALARLMTGFDAFLYGHPGAHESAVRGLEARGIRSFRYFNVFHTDPAYPSWPGYYRDLWARLEGIHGWIRGVNYPFYGNPRQPNPIIDHTRSDVTAVVARSVDTWARTIGADHVFLDCTFDELSDWMIRPGESWPWAAGDHQRKNLRWRQNMQSLIQQVEERYPVMINGSVRLRAGTVLYENQVWNHRRGWSSWDDLVARMLAHETIPAVHVGHDMLRSWEYTAGENMTLAVWLLADQSYLLVEPEGRPLAWAREIQQNGLHNFEARGPAVEVSRGVWRRQGRVGNQPWTVEVDLKRMQGRVWRGPS
jgi:hypothetical protein